MPVPPVVGSQLQEPGVQPPQDSPFSHSRSDWQKMVPAGGHTKFAHKSPGGPSPWHLKLHGTRQQSPKCNMSCGRHEQDPMTYFGLKVPTDAEMTQKVPDVWPHPPLHPSKPPLAPTCRGPALGWMA
eukprot:gene4159-4481_t